MTTSPDTSADAPHVGRVLDGRYRLESLIARGGMATVYEGTDQRLDRKVAVKVMHRAFADDPQFVARFTREARSAARLSAPEVVAVFDQGHDSDGGLVYLVMELVRGRDLRALLRERGALPPAKALAVLDPVLAALAAAHAGGIVHRDVKPENVLLGDDGRIKVADFGLARAVEASSVTSSTGVLLGTVSYLAPEQIERGVADPRTDVYAAGVMLWELLVGAPPHDGETAVKVLFRHVNHDVPLPSSEVDGIPPELDDLVVRATRRDPALRPADGQVFLAEVRALRATLPAVADNARHDTVVVPDQARPQRTRQRASTLPQPIGPVDGGGAGEAIDLDAIDLDAIDLDAPTGPSRVLPRRIAPRPKPAKPPKPAKQPKKPRRMRRPGLTRRRLLVLLVLLVLLAGGGGTGAWWLTSGRYTQAPGVLTLAGEAARTQLRDDGFSVRTAPEQVFSETVQAGSVAAQDPGPGSKVLKNGTITLTLSKGPERLAVPDNLMGMTQAAAEAALTNAGLTAGPPAREFSARPIGEVVDVEPGAGELLRRNAVVTLTLSKGIEQLQVPNVVTKSRDAATAEITAGGFVPAVNEVFDETAAAGSVMAQSPAGGLAGKGSTVTLTVSKGPEPRTIPALVGSSKNTAKKALADLGLNVQVVEIPGPGTVRSMSPGAGSKVARGSTVTLYVF